MRWEDVIGREQRNGFWFLMLCSCHPGSYYKFQVDYSTESGYFLSLGASERTSYPVALTLY